MHESHDRTHPCAVAPTRPRSASYPPRWLAARTASLVLAVLLLVPASAGAFTRPPTPLDYTPEFDRGVLGEGRQAYRERRDHARAWDSYTKFHEYYAANPGDPVAAWHLAMSCYYLGIRVADEPEQRKQLFAEGRDVAAAGLERDPECGPCHLMAAINNALWGKEVGIFRTIVGLPKVKHHLARAAELDPTFGGAAAFRVQANIFKALPRMFGGGRTPARRAIEQAIRVSPEEHLNYEFLMDLLARDYRDMDAAALVARRGLAVPSPGPEYVESVDAIEGLRRFLRRYTGGGSR